MYGEDTQKSGRLNALHEDEKILDADRLQEQVRERGMREKSGEGKAYILLKIIVESTKGEVRPFCEPRGVHGGPPGRDHFKKGL